jgi:hypothetical protein
MISWDKRLLGRMCHACNSRSLLPLRVSLKRIMNVLCVFAETETSKNSNPTSVRFGREKRSIEDLREKTFLCFCFLPKAIDFVFARPTFFCWNLNCIIWGGISQQASPNLSWPRVVKINNSLLWKKLLRTKEKHRCCCAQRFLWKKPRMFWSNGTKVKHLQKIFDRDHSMQLLVGKYYVCTYNISNSTKVGRIFERLC